MIRFCLFYDTKPFEAEGSWWLIAKPLALNVYMLAGRWVSLGIHLSIVPLYIDLHILWFVISIMSASRAEEITDYEKAYIESKSTDLCDTDL